MRYVGLTLSRVRDDEDNVMPWLRSGWRSVADSLGLGEGVPLYAFIVCHVHCVCDYVFIYCCLFEVIPFSALSRLERTVRRSGDGAVAYSSSMPDVGLVASLWMVISGSRYQPHSWVAVIIMSLGAVRSLSVLELLQVLDEKLNSEFVRVRGICSPPLVPAASLNTEVSVLRSVHISRNVYVLARSDG